MTFTPETAVEAQKRSAAKRQAKWAAERRRTEVVHRIVTELDDIHPAALDGALRAMTRASDALETVPADDALDVKRIAETAEILHRISRLASGQSTSNVAHAQLSEEERAARLARLRGDAPPSPTE